MVVLIAATMDTAKRIAAVRNRLRELQTDEHFAKRSGPPCSGCVHVAKGSIGFPAQEIAVCNHLAYARRAYDPSTGKYEEAADTPVTLARSPEGLCGPEGLLHETPPLPFLPIRVANNVVTVVGALGIAAGAYGVALQLGLV